MIGQRTARDGRRSCRPRLPAESKVWMPDEAIEGLRRLVAQRTQVVQQMTQMKNRIHSVLHASLIPPFQGELFSAGRSVSVSTSRAVAVIG